MESINLDVLPGAIPPIVHVSQGDVGRQFQIAIYDDTGAEYSLDGKTLSIVGQKVDGNIFQYAIPSSGISGNTMTITTEEQMTPVAGKVFCEIRIEQGDTKIGTCNFVLDVEKGPADAGTISSSTLYVFNVLLDRAEADIVTTTAAAATATQKASEASASATTAAEFASTATTEAGNASSSATSAANSASAAATSETNAADSATAAYGSATNASASATSADTSATAAATSASAASTSASNAATYASAADTSADTASDYATAASQSATAAATSVTAAGNSEISAAASATAAVTGALNAATSESNASTSETNAADSATAAAGSATTAANSATAAADSATTAAASESKITNMTVSSQSVPYTQSAEVVKTEVGGAYNLDFAIPRGEPTSGHDVEANPTDSATGGNLDKLGIDGTIYNVPGNKHRFSQQAIHFMIGDTPNITGFNLECKLIPAYYDDGSWNKDETGSLVFSTGFVAAENILWNQYIPDMSWTTPPASSTYLSATDSKWTLDHLIVWYYYDDTTVVGSNDDGMTPFKDMSYIPIINASVTNNIPTIIRNDEYESASFSKYTQYVSDASSIITYSIGEFGEDVPNNYGLSYPNLLEVLLVLVC